MTRTRHTEEQIIAVLKDAQGGVSVQDLCRQHGISDATFYKWKFSMSHVQDYRRTSRRMLKKARLLTRPTLNVISPARPESAKTDSSPWDAPCSK